MTGSPGEKTPRLDLQTLTRGDGLLGMRAAPGFGPRGAQLTVVRLHGAASAAVCARRAAAVRATPGSKATVAPSYTPFCPKRSTDSAFSRLKIAPRAPLDGVTASAIQAS